MISSTLHYFIAHVAKTFDKKTKIYRRDTEDTEKIT